MKKRGQAAMEFLMTYGWAILAVLISIAALAYFGVLNPSRFLPQSCTLFPGIACTDVTVNNAGVSLVVQNGLGQNLNPFTVNIPGCTAVSADNGLSDSEREAIALPCSQFMVTNSRFKGDIDIEYVSPQGIQHNKKGSLVAQVENDYVLNGGFEAGGSPWQVDVGCGFGVFPCMICAGGCSGIGQSDTSTFTSGSGSYRLDVGSNPHPDPHYPLVSQNIAFLLPPGTYELSFMVKSLVASSNDVGVSFRSTVGGEPFFCDYIIPAGSSVTTSWTKITRQCTVTDTSRFYISYPHSNGILWIDDVSLRKI